MTTLGTYNPETKEWTDDDPEIENIALIQATADEAEKKIREALANKERETRDAIIGCGTKSRNC